MAWKETWKNTGIAMESRGTPTFTLTGAASQPATQLEARSYNEFVDYFKFFIPHRSSHTHKKSAVQGNLRTHLHTPEKSLAIGSQPVQGCEGVRCARKGEGNSDILN